MAIQSKTAADSDLQEWYAARQAVTNGKSITISTSAGTRVVSYANLSEINKMIAKLERIVGTSTTTRKGRHDFALANFNNDANS